MIHRIGGAELTQPGRWIAGHAKQHVASCSERGLVVAEVADLGGAAWRERLGEEVDDDWMAAQAGKADQLSILVLQLQFRRLVTGPQDNRHRSSSLPVG